MIVMPLTRTIGRGIEAMNNKRRMDSNEVCKEAIPL